MRKGYQFDSFAQLQRLARRRLPPHLFHDMMGGVGRGVTARRNTEVFDEVSFQPRAAVGFAGRDLRTTVLGRELSLPVILAPVGGLRMVHPGGAVAAARAARGAGTLAGVSMMAGHRVTDLGTAAEGCWQQLYLHRGRERAEQIIAEATARGCSALVVTVDCPVSPKRPLNLRVSVDTALRFGPELVRRPVWTLGFLRDGAKLAAANEALGPRVDRAVLWSDLRWIRQAWRGPLIVKGVVRPDDARLAVAEGAAAVVVSNHGGLTVDGAPPTLAALPGVVAAVGGAAEVLLDGGVRQGADVLKAVALGARAVLIGRPYIAGLAVGGGAGVAAVIEMFRFQTDAALAMIGCPSIAALDRGYVAAPERWAAVQAR
jgi:isopentenyl diphosphate isomerase/L-lactate dehydrogenase-like FMN-dependent dehydrogenase